MATATEERARARAREEEREAIYGTTRDEREMQGNGSTSRVYRHEMFDGPTFFRSLDDREDIALGSVRGILGSWNRIWFGTLQMNIELLAIAEDASRRSLMVMGR